MATQTPALVNRYVGGGFRERGVHRHLRWKSSVIRPLKLALDIACLTSAFAIAYLLRYDFVLPDNKMMLRIAGELPLVVLIQLSMLRLAGAHSFVWHYFSLAEARIFLWLASCSLAVMVIVRVALTLVVGDWFPPIALLIVDTVLAFGGLVGMRALCRTVIENRNKKIKARPAGAKKTRILLIGAGRAGMLAARELRYRASGEYEIAGFIDDDPLKQGSLIQGIRVLGPVEELPRLAKELDIDHVVITIAVASRQEILRILKVCEGIPIKARIIPTVDEILLGNVEISRIRDVQIEDLLGRESVHFDEQSVMKFITSRRVIVTGAGGSIGSELARQVVRYRPSELLLVERAEFALFNIHRELSKAWPDVSIIPLLADVGEEDRMSVIFQTHRPEVVIHAAAHKHVPMMEVNPTEAITNNILATHVLGTLAGKFGVEVFVLISTDKAVRPTSVMGASKRMTELLVQGLNTQYQTRYVAVRFGNVIGSTGSVIPIFLDQIKNGGPVTVTHPDMERYFMTIPEAAHLVLEACTIGKGGEVFVLDMGQPVRVLDLAERLITLAGLKPGQDIEIAFTGIRPGEKLVEETAHTEEHLAKTIHPKIFIGEIVASPHEPAEDALDRLAVLAKNGDEAGLRFLLNEVVPESHIHTGKRPLVKVEGTDEEAFAVGSYQKGILTARRMSQSQTGPAC